MGSIDVVAAEPQLFVTDLDRALRFYTGKLGFAVVFVHGEPAFYAQVGRGGARLNLREVTGPVYDGAFLVREPDPLSAVLTLHDAEPLFAEYRDAGVVFHQEFRTQPWGSRTFIVEDSEGNLLLFAGPGGEHGAP